MMKSSSLSRVGYLIPKICLLANSSKLQTKKYLYQSKVIRTMEKKRHSAKKVSKPSLLSKNSLRRFTEVRAYFYGFFHSDGNKFNIFRITEQKNKRLISLAILIFEVA